MNISKLYNLDLKFLFCISLLFAVFLFSRLYKIGSIPQSVYWDEASIGYNAYSVANTLRDEWGEFMPLHFRAFGEFKLPVYIYSVAALIKAFGLSTVTVRIPSALFSMATIMILALIVHKLTNSKWLGLLSAFFLTISPWFFIFSRTGYEVTAGVFFFILSFYLFLLSLKRVPLFLLSTLCLIVTIYSYNSFRIISPISLVLYLSAFFVLNKESNKKKLAMLFFTLLLVLASALPIYRLIKNDFGLSRFSAVRAEYSDIASNYLSHFSPNFLLRGDINPRSQIPGFGQIWHLEIPLFLLGILFIVKQKKITYFFPLLLFLISFIPAALTRESPHALRSLNSVIFFEMVLVFGIKLLWDKSKRLGLTIALLVIALNSSFFINYFRVFITNYSTQSSEAWQYGYKEVFDKYNLEIERADKIIISDIYAQPYIFALFYGKVDPNRFKETVIYNTVDKWGVSSVASFGKFEFREALEGDVKQGNLIFATPGEIISKVKPRGEIKFLDGATTFFVY